MSLVECPECKKQISDSAKTCPYCGFPMEEYITTIVENKTTMSVVNTENLNCPKCGTQNYKEYKFCKKCGNKLMVTVGNAPVLDVNEYLGFDSPNDVSVKKKQIIEKKVTELQNLADDIEEQMKKMGVPPKDFIPVPNEPIEAPSNLIVLKSEMQRLLQYFSERTVDFKIYKKLLIQFNSLLEGGGLLFVCAVVSFLEMFACVFIIEFNSNNHVGILMEWAIFIPLTLINYIITKKATEEKKEKLTNDLMLFRKRLIFHYNNANNCFISYDHCDPEIISAVYNNLISGRATTYASALNVYLSDETTRMMIQRMDEQFERMRREIHRDMNNR